MNVEERLLQLELEITRTKVEQASLEAFLIEKGIATGAELIEAHRKGYVDALKMDAVRPSEIPEMFR
jgi:hypothetical protein